MPIKVSIDPSEGWMKFPALHILYSVREYFLPFLQKLCLSFLISRHILSRRREPIYERIEYRNCKMIHVWFILPRNKRKEGHAACPLFFHLFFFFFLRSLFWRACSTDVQRKAPSKSGVKACWDNLGGLSLFCTIRVQIRMGRSVREGKKIKTNLATPLFIRKYIRERLYSAADRAMALRKFRKEKIIKHPWHKSSEMHIDPQLFSAHYR